MYIFTLEMSVYILIMFKKKLWQIVFISFSTLRKLLSLLLNNMCGELL